MADRHPAGITVALLLGLALLAASVPLEAQQVPASPPPARPRIGLALGGGSARGLAHIGLLEWFEEHRIPIDVIAGTSMGGLVGGAYATGLSPKEIQTLLDGTDWKMIFQGEAPFSDKSFRRKQDERAYPSKLAFGLKNGLKLPSGLNEGQQVDLLLDAITLQYGELAAFDQLPTPFRCVAADLVSARPVTFKDGSLSYALRSTMSLPGVFIPVRIEDQVLVDGGIFDNIPAGVVRDMGADIVIAISVGGSDVAGEGEGSGVAPTYSMFAVLGNMINAMMAGNTKRGLSNADLVIRPAVDGVSSMDFPKTTEIAALGYQAAEAHSAELLKYAVDEATYAAFRAARDGRRLRAEIVPTTLEVAGVSDASQSVIRRRMASHLNVPVDTVKLARDITRLGGTDRYETIGYQIVSAPTGPVLKLRVQPKPYGPPFLALGVDITNTSGTNLQLGLGSRLTAYDVLGYGSELRGDLHVGSGFEVRGELYRPIGRSRWFGALSGGIRQIETEFFAGQESIADYRLTRTSAAVDLGYNTGYRSEVRLGYEEANMQASVRVGNPVLPELEGREALVRLQGVFDDQDSPMVPSRGTYARARVRHLLDTATVRSELPAGQTIDDRPFTTADLALTWFKPVGSRLRLLTAVQGGTSFGRTPLPPNDFTLGGPFRFGAYNVGEIRSSDFAVATGGLMRELSRLPEVLGGGVFGGAWIETGSAFDGEGMRTSVTAGLVIETLLGPMFAGGSVGFDGRHQVYVGMGPLFQRGSK